jgi:hypothetical protein
VELSSFASGVRNQIVIHDLTLSLGVLLRPLRQYLVLLLLRELEMLLAEEPEPRPLRPVLAAGIAAAHVALQTTATATWSSAVALPSCRCGQCGGDMFGEKLGEVVDENIEGMRGASGHMTALTRRRDIAQPYERLSRNHSARSYSSTVIPQESASASRRSW